MAISLKELMIKRKSPAVKPERTEAEKKKRSKQIGIAIIVATFAAIVILSIVSQGDSDGVPEWNVIVTRVVLLSVTTAVYFFMLFRSISGGKKTEEKERPKGKKKK